MVSPVENLTRLRGTLVSRRPRDDLADWDLVVLAVESAEPVHGADLLSGRLGEDVEVSVPHRLLGEAAPGSRVSVRARLTPRGVMGEPHPPPGEFSIGPP